MEMLSGAEMVVKSLIDQGVKHVFGYPGGAVLDIYDALHTVGGIDHILVRHEQAAVHMADGYARSTGEVGVILVTSGPGATNAITGIATAYMDSVPLVVLSGQVASSLIGNDAFQECDMVGISRPIVKHSFLIKKPKTYLKPLRKPSISLQVVVQVLWLSTYLKIRLIRQINTLTAILKRFLYALITQPFKGTKGRLKSVNKIDCGAETCFLYRWRGNQRKLFG